MFCIDMLDDGSILLEVWCETLDDVTLIWESSAGDEFEFVQVKSNNLGHFWSIAELCSKGKKTKGATDATSIVAKSLRHDQGIEPCRFRIATSLPFNDDLKLLELPLNAAARAPEGPKIVAIAEELRKRHPGLISPNGHDPGFWASRTKLHPVGTVDDVQNRNLLKLRAFVEGVGVTLSDQKLRDLYDWVLRLVYDAARVDWNVCPDDKKVIRKLLVEEIRERAASLAQAGSGTGAKLRAKMEAASLSPEMIRGAQELRRAYRRKLLTQGYLEVSSREDYEAVVLASMHELLGQLESGVLPPGGPAFHSRCLARLAEHEEKITPKPAAFLPFLQGYMYDLADRCVHRFR